MAVVAESVELFKQSESCGYGWAMNLDFYFSSQFRTTKHISGQFLDYLGQVGVEGCVYVGVEA